MREKAADLQANNTNRKEFESIKTTPSTRVLTEVKVKENMRDNIESLLQRGESLAGAMHECASLSLKSNEFYRIEKKKSSGFNFSLPSVSGLFSSKKRSEVPQPSTSGRQLESRAREQANEFRAPTPAPSGIAKTTAYLEEQDVIALKKNQEVYQVYSMLFGVVNRLRKWKRPRNMLKCITTTSKISRTSINLSL